MDEHHSMKKYPKGTEVESKAMWGEECDLLILAANEKTLTIKNAPMVKAKVK